MKIISFLAECDAPDTPFVIKPDTCLLRGGEAYYLPPLGGRFLLRPFVFVRVTRMAKAIGILFAGRCYEEGGLAVEFSAAEVLDECRRQGLPWDRAVSYDKSTAVPDRLCPVGDGDWTVGVSVDGKSCFEGVVERVRERIDRAVSAASMLVTLKVGDMVMVPLADAVAEVRIGNTVKGVCGDTVQLDFDCK